MVSVRRYALVAAMAAALNAQQTTAARVDTPPAAAPPAAVKPLTPEMRGDILMARKAYREAVEMYQKAPQNSAVVLNKIGIAHHQMGELDTAKKFYERAVKIDKTYSEGVNNLGTIFYAKKSYRKAVGQYNKALKLSPLSASIHSNLGTAQFARKKYKEAVAAYEKALELDPDVFEHRNTHGVLLQERSVQERAKFHYFLAKTYAKSGAVERALLYIRKALEEGFKEKNKFKEDPEFAKLQELPEFQQLMLMEPRVL
jgi:tetratricopeptide (TPR) repeat protein